MGQLQVPLLQAIPPFRRQQLAPLLRIDVQAGLRLAIPPLQHPQQQEARCGTLQQHSAHPLLPLFPQQ